MRQTLRVADASGYRGPGTRSRRHARCARARAGGAAAPPLPARREPNPQGCDSAARGVRGPQWPRPSLSITSPA